MMSDSVCGDFGIGKFVGRICVVVWGVIEIEYATGRAEGRFYLGLWS